MNTKTYYPLRETTSAIIQPSMSINMTGLSDDDIQQELSKIASLEAMPGMRPRVCVTLVLDLSGSMSPYYNILKLAVRGLIERLQLVKNRQYSLHIVAITNDRPIPIYFGDVKQLDVNYLLSNLPRPNGMTPYAEALSMGLSLQNEMMRILEKKKHWYNPCGVFLTFTDCLANDRDDSYASSITQALSEKAKNGTALLTEFVTQNNRQGLVSGGYKVFMDQGSSARQIEEYAKALRTGSSSAATGTDFTFTPNVRDRVNYNRYLADRLLCELNAAFQRSIRPIMRGE